VDRFGDAPEPALRERVAAALVNKGIRLGQLGRFEEEIEVYDLVARRRNPLVPNCACIPPRVVARRLHTQQVCALLAPRDAGADRTLTFKRLQRRTTSVLSQKFA
jgi:hypothetical protein